MELRDLRPSITDMTEEQLRAALMEIRSNRRVSKRPPTPTKKPSSTIKAEVSASSLIDAMSGDDAEKMLAMLMAKKGVK